MTVMVQLNPLDSVGSIPRTLGLKEIPTLDVGIDRRALLCRVVHISHANVWTSSMSVIEPLLSAWLCDLALNQIDA